MPIYEYECGTCGHRFEQIMRLGAEAPPCPTCASAQVQKRISASGFILKGGGWYKDHYGLKSGGASEKSAEGKSEGAKSEGAKSETAKSDSGSSTTGSAASTGTAATTGTTSGTGTTSSTAAK